MAKGVPETHPEERNALNISPRKNWVEKAGGLPSYINSVAVALVRGGMPRERAIPTAVNVVKKTCATGLWGGRPNAKVSPAIRAAACKAAADWEAKKGGAKLSACADCGAVDLAGPVVTSKAGGSYTTNALLKPPSGLKPGHMRALAKANANLAKAGMPKGKRRRVIASMAKGLRSGKVSLSSSKPEELVDLAFNPSEQRAPAGAAGGGRWSAQQASQQRTTGRQAAQSRTGRKVNPLNARALSQEAALEAKGARTAGTATKKQRARLKAVRALIAAELKRQPQQLNPHQKGLLWRVEHADDMNARVQAARDLIRTLKRNAKATKKVNLSVPLAGSRTVDLAFHPDEVRGWHGRWSKGLDSRAADAHLKETQGGTRLSKDASKAARAYVTGSADGTAGKRWTQRTVSRRLRAATPKLTKPQVAEVQGLDQAFAEVPPTARPLKLYRGVPHNWNGTHKLKAAAGEALADPGYMSTTTSPKVARDFAGHQGDVEQITLPAGSKALHVNSHVKGAYGGEHEVLLPRGTVVHVVGVEKRLTPTVGPHGREIAEGRTVMAEVAASAPVSLASIAAARAANQEQAASRRRAAAKAAKPAPRKRAPRLVTSFIDR